MMLISFLTVLSVSLAARAPLDLPRSEWSETIFSGQELRGWRPVGNMRVFGFMGPSVWNAALHQITGPHIMLASVMNNSSAFGPATLSLSVGGENVAFEKATLSRFRGTGIVVADLQSSVVEMRVYTYAPMGLNALLRTVTVRNKGREPLSDVVLRATVHRTEVREGRLFDSFKGSTDGQAMGQTRQLFSSFLEPCEASASPERVGVLSTRLGDVSPGASVERTQYMVFSMAEVGDEEKTLARIRKPAAALLRECAEGWRKWLSETVALQCPDTRLTDLLEENKVSVLMQTAEPQFAAGPMEFFAGVWIRDANGPLKYYLRMGDFQAARKMLEFYYRAAAYNKAIPNFFPMDIDLSVPVDPKFDWSKVRVDRVETPCWLIMNHAWYYRFTGDLKPIREHWEYLKRCLIGQLVDETGTPFTTVNYGYTEPKQNTLYRFPHHGDETWIYPGFEVLNSPVFPEPNDHVHWDEYSTDSTWEFVVSAEILAGFAGLLGKPEEAAKFRKIAADSRAACERDYWMPERGFYAPAMGMVSLDRHQPPFTAVNLNPLWIGYLKPDDPKAVSNLLETVKYTWNPNAVLDATETLKIYVGMLPGMFLYNLAAVRHALGEQALRAVVEVASPSGEYAEKHRTDPDSYRSDFLGHRIRPWEGGINMDAVLYYLTGLEPEMGRKRVTLSPRLPFGWPQMSVERQRLGDGTLNMDVRDSGGIRRYRLNWKGPHPLQIGFVIELPLSTISEVKLRGKPVKVSPTDRFGVTTARLDLSLQSGSPAEIQVRYGKKPTQPLRVERKRYQYVVPKNVPFHDIVFWAQEPRKTSPQDVRAYDLLRAKGNTRVILPFVPCSPDWLRPFLLKPDGSLNARVFFMGPRSVTDSLKYQKWWTDPALTRLFRDFMTAGGVMALVRPGETASEWFGSLLEDSGYAVMPAPSAVPIACEGAEPIIRALGLSDVPADGMYVYRGMTALARPGTESKAGTLIGRVVGKGMFVATLASPDATRMAELALRLADAKVQAELREALSREDTAESSAVFEDQGKDGSFSDDFRSYPEGSTGLPAWLPISGVWKIQDGKYHELASHAYDFCSMLNVKLTGDYRVESTSHLVEGIYEAGFVINSASRYSIARSQMVRFSGQEQVWCGPLQGGFSLKHVLDTGIAIRDSTPHTLAIDVYNSKGTYDVWVNGKRIGTDLPLAVRLENGQAGYIGLLSCRGHVAYSSVEVRPMR